MSDYENVKSTVVNILEREAFKYGLTTKELCENYAVEIDEIISDYTTYTGGIARLSKDGLAAAIELRNRIAEEQQ